MTNSIILLALQLVFATESDSGRNVKTNDGGRAVGAYQIWPAAVREANRIAGRNIWTPEDRENVQMSRAMCLMTLQHHYNRGFTNPVSLAARWRNPYSDTPSWHAEKLQHALSLFPTAPVRIAGRRRQR